MKKRDPTNCPIVFSLDIFGDRWSLVILRDLLFVGKSHFHEFLASEEKVASNILSNRLELLTDAGILLKHDDPKKKSAAVYVPTKKALDLLPMLIEMMRWGILYNPDIDLNIPVVRQIQVDPEGVRKQVLEKFVA